MGVGVIGDGSDFGDGVVDCSSDGVIFYFDNVFVFDEFSFVRDN